MKSLQPFPRQSSSNPSSSTTAVTYDYLKHLISTIPTSFLMLISKWKEFLWCNRVVRRVSFSSGKLFHVIFQSVICIWSLFVNINGLCLHIYIELWKDFHFECLLHICTPHVPPSSTPPSSLLSLSPPLLPINRLQARNTSLGQAVITTTTMRERQRDRQRCTHSEMDRDTLKVGDNKAFLVSISSSPFEIRSSSLSHASTVK